MKINYQSRFSAGLSQPAQEGVAPAFCANRGRRSVAGQDFGFLGQRQQARVN
jgi:hypothetical protein